MKYFKFKPIILLFSLVILAGCDFMDCDESSDYTKQDIFESYNRTKQMVTHIYGFLPHDFCNTDGAMLDAATDDAVHVYESSEVQRFVNGTWSPVYTADDVWGTYYKGIRAANRYLKEAEGLTFEDWKFADNYETIMKDFTNYQYEVRFLRAFFYFELIKRYHNVPFTTEVLTVEQANEMKPESFEKIADFIISECTEIAKTLPVNYNGFSEKEVGRITKGAALALKARVALYAASPLFADHDMEKWKAAAKASGEIISRKGELGYSLVKYLELFNDKNVEKAEIILARPIGESGSFEQANFPMGVEKGKTSTCPTQNLMEAYDKLDGSEFSWENLAPGADPYSGRDPRMKWSIVCNNMKWPTQSPIEIWEGGANGLPLNNATITGYYLRKYVNNNISFASDSKNTKKHHNWVLFRYGEVLLNYAEAMIMAFNDASYKNADGGFPLSAWEAVNQLRHRPGMTMADFPKNLSTSEFLRRLKKERRVELAFEGHRFWDVRRWKELGETDRIFGVKIQKTADGMKYDRFLLAVRPVEDKMYFYPISNTERYKNQNLGQNPGW